MVFYGQDQSAWQKVLRGRAVIRWPTTTVKVSLRIMLDMAQMTANRRRLPRFTLRGLLAAIAIAAIGFAWYARVERQRQIVAILVRLNPGVGLVYDDERREVNFAKAWLRDWLGRDYTSSVVAVELFYPTDDELRVVAALPWLEGLRLQRAIDLTSKGIAQLAGIRSLKSLVLADGWNVDDAAMNELARMQSLEELTLDAGPRVSAAGVMKLTALVRLKQLRLSCADDQAAQAIDALRTSLPHCAINESMTAGVL